MKSTAKPRRLDQILSAYGYCSRSEARAWIRAGRVEIAGERAGAPDEKALVADVRIDGESVECPDGILALLHKPAGCVCSHEAREGPSVYDLLPARWQRRNPPVTTIGRLDKDTTGVLLITDDGDLVQLWTSPRHKVPKVYEVTVDADLRTEMIARFASGTAMIEGDDKPCLPAQLEFLAPREARLTLLEGRFHQVKRMFAAEGCNVVRLHRSRFGEFDVTGIAPGEFKLLDVRAFR